MKTTLVTIALSAVYLVSVQAHGRMTQPTPRVINDKYRKDCYFGLKGAGDNELLAAPLESLRTRDQPDQPAAPTFHIDNGCRGIDYVPGEPTTAVTPGGEVTVGWEIQAPHPGFMEVYIVKSSTDASGKITYTREGDAIKRMDSFGTNGGTGSTLVTLPASLSGCESAGNCALQMYWHSAQAGQTYVSCADIVTSRAAGGDDDDYDDAPAPGSTPTQAPEPTAAPLTPSPAATVTPIPSAIEEPADDVTSAPPKSNCVRRMRRN